MFRVAIFIAAFVGGIDYLLQFLMDSSKINSIEDILTTPHQENPKHDIKNTYNDLIRNISFAFLWYLSYCLFGS